MQEVTRNCALDALAHALEAIWNVRSNPVSDALAVSAARDILTALPTVLAQEDGPAAQDDEVRHSITAFYSCVHSDTQHIRTPFHACVHSNTQHVRYGP